MLGPPREQAESRRRRLPSPRDPDRAPVATRIGHHPGEESEGDPLEERATPVPDGLSAENNRFPILMIAAGMLLLFGTLGSMYFTRQIENPESVPLPPHLGNVAIITKSDGWQARLDFQALHQKDFPLTSGSVGHYGMEREATLWVAGAPFKWLAGKLVNDMRQRIAEGNSPFSPTGSRRHLDHTVYELEGMGQKHVYYQSDHYIIWLAADADLAEEALSQTMAFYR